MRYSGFVKAGTGAGTGMTMAQARFSESPIPNPQSPAPQEPKMSSIDFTSFLKLMAHQKASDLLITAGMPPSIKVNGKITTITQNPLTPQQAHELVLNVMSPPQRAEFERTGRGARQH